MSHYRNMKDAHQHLAFPQPNSASNLWRCLGYLRPYWRRTAGAYIALLGINAISLMIPQFIRWIVDQGIRAQDTQVLLLSVLALLSLTFIKGVLTLFQGQWTETASQGVAYDLRNEMHRKLAALSFSYHDRSETGQLLSIDDSGTRYVSHGVLGRPSALGAQSNQPELAS